MGLFSGLGKAEASINRRYDQEGVYVELIERVIKKDTRKNVTAIILEKRCLLVIDAKGAAKPHAIGERCSHFMGNDKDSFEGNVKGVLTQLAGAVLGDDFNPDTLSDEEWVELANNMIGDEQPFGGLFVVVDNTTVTTKADKLFTRVSYEEVLSAKQLKEMLVKQGEVDKRDVVEFLFPGGELDKMIKADEAEA